MAWVLQGDAACGDAERGVSRLVGFQVIETRLVEQEHARTAPERPVVTRVLKGVNDQCQFPLFARKWCQIHSVRLPTGLPGFA